MPAGTTLRNVRISDDLWDAALRRAEKDNISVSEVIRELLQQWVDS
jgi:predicted CopG family antitoxin